MSGAEQYYQFAFTSPIDGHTDPTLLVARVIGEEWMSYPFRFTITVAMQPDSGDGDGGDSSDGNDVPLGLDPAKVIGRPAKLIIKQGEKQSDDSWALVTREIYGVVTSLRTANRLTDNWPQYILELRPRLWRLAQTRRSRTFRNMSVPQILRDVLMEHGLADDRDFKLIGSDLAGGGNPDCYPRRASIVQYNESDLDFLNRWLAHEGIFYYFVHDEVAGDVVTVGDQKTAYTDIMAVAGAEPDYEKLSEVPWSYANPEQRDSTDWQAAEDIKDIVASVTQMPCKLYLGDYDPAASEDEVQHEEAVDQAGHGARYEPRNYFRTAAQAAHLGTLRKEMYMCRREVYRGTGIVRSFRAGNCFTLTDHFEPRLNRVMLLIYVKHVGKQDISAGSVVGASYRNEFVAIPGGENDVTFRPARESLLDFGWSEDGDEWGMGAGAGAGTTASGLVQPLKPWPHISGLYRGRVAGGGGAGDHPEIDPTGAYTVSMPFAAGTDNTVGPVRRAQPLAGQPDDKNNSVGLHFPLYKGVEVAMGFEDGDPDRPLILGAVPNQATASPVADGSNKLNIIGTRGRNRVVFDDDKLKTTISAVKALELTTDTSRSDGTIDIKTGKTDGNTVTLESFKVSQKQSNKINLSLKADYSVTVSLLKAEISFAIKVSLTSSITASIAMDILKLGYSRTLIDFDFGDNASTSADNKLGLTGKQQVEVTSDNPVVNGNIIHIKPKKKEGVPAAAVKARMVKKLASLIPGPAKTLYSAVKDLKEGKFKSEFKKALKALYESQPQDGADDFMRFKANPLGFPESALLQAPDISILAPKAKTGSTSKITMDASGPTGAITMKAKKEMTAESPKVEVKAKTKVQLTGGNKAQVQLTAQQALVKGPKANLVADTDIGISGSQIKINGKATVEIKANGVVKLG